MIENHSSLTELPFQPCVLPDRAWQAAERDRQCRSRFAQSSTYRTEPLGCRNHWRGCSVRQDPFKGRTAHTKCGLCLLTSCASASSPSGIIPLGAYFRTTRNLTPETALDGTCVHQETRHLPVAADTRSMLISSRHPKRRIDVRETGNRRISVGRRLF